MPVALVAAIILVVQSFMMSWAVAAQPMLDAFGNPLCVTGSNGHGIPDSDNARIPDCCAVGCSFASTSAVRPGDGEAEFAWPQVSRQDRTLRVTDAVVVEQDHDPWTPRGPPPVSN